MGKTKFQHSATMREYLAEIYRLQEDSPTVSTTSLAERLEVSAPAVPRMLKRLKNVGLVKHVPYQGVELTDLGRDEALREIRRHRILERFLVDVMNFSWDDAHIHADDLSQGLTDTVVARMDELTDYPTHCPHGEPIPDKNGKITLPDDLCIVGLAVGNKGAVSRVRTHDMEMLRYFAELGIVPQAQFEIVARAPFNGPIRLRMAHDDVVLGASLAQCLWVTHQN